MAMSIKRRGAFVILSAAMVFVSGVAQAKHQARHHRHHWAADQRQYSSSQPSPAYEQYQQQYSVCGAPCRPGQIDHSRVGGFDPSFNPRGGK